jgi:hypothetical protein
MQLKSTDLLSIGLYEVLMSQDSAAILENNTFQRLTKFNENNLVVVQCEPSALLDLSH